MLRSSRGFDSPCLIRYQTSALPAGWRIRLSINSHTAYENSEDTLAKVSVPGLIVGSHLVQVSLLDQEGNASSGVQVRVTGLPTFLRLLPLDRIPPHESCLGSASALVQNLLVRVKNCKACRHGGRSCRSKVAL